MIGRYDSGEFSADRGYYYDTATICRNGHLINDASTERPEKSRKFCGRCGAEALLRCDECSHFFIGARFYNGTRSGSSPTSVPSYCEYCGKSFPWTQNALTQADELVDLIDTLSEEQKHALKASFPDLVADSPKTQVAAVRTGKLMKDVESNFKTALKDILVGVATEGAKAVLKNVGFPF